MGGFVSAFLVPCQLLVFIINLFHVMYRAFEVNTTIYKNWIFIDSIGRFLLLSQCMFTSSLAFLGMVICMT